jgi:HEPN domain-containing protein
MADFLDQYEAYQARVTEFSEKLGVERHKLKLRASEIATLINQTKLGRLRDVDLFQLKELSHVLFRTPSGNDDFDRFVSEIYHELSVLREEHYSIETYIPAYEEGPHKSIAETMLDEADELFPRKMNAVYELFDKAKSRLEELLPAWKRDPVFVRSLYLFASDFLPKIYSDGLEEIYAVIYPKFKAAEGYYEVARSFHQSGFYDRAQRALRKAKVKLANGKVTEGDSAEFRKDIEELARKIGDAQSSRHRPV